MANKRTTSLPEDSDTEYTYARDGTETLLLCVVTRFWGYVSGAHHAGNLFVMTKKSLITLCFVKIV